MQLKRHSAYRSPRRHRAEVEARARTLIAAHGGAAHGVARTLSRQARPRGAPKHPLWHAVVRRIAALTAP